MSEYGGSVIGRVSEKRGAGRRIIVNPGYRVQVSPAPIVIDKKGKPVPDAFIVAVRFPRKITSTPAGHVPVVSEAGAARILVGDTTIRGVPLC